MGLHITLHNFSVFDMIKLTHKRQTFFNIGFQQDMKTSTLG